MRRLRRAVTAVIVTLMASGALAQTTPAPAPSDGTMLLTVFFKHDQSKTLDEINEQLRKNGYYEKFPPQGVEVVSWYVVMGIGQIATFRFPTARLREMNRIIEETAWGGYRTEFFPTYDYKAAAEAQRQQMLAKPR